MECHHTKRLWGIDSCITRHTHPDFSLDRPWFQAFASVSKQGLLNMKMNSILHENEHFGVKLLCSRPHFEQTNGAILALYNITSLYKLRWTKCKTMELLNEENGMLAENNNYWAKPSCAPKNSWRSPGPGIQNNFFLNLLLWNRSLFFFRNLLLLLPLVIFPRLSNSRWSPSCKNERLARFAPGFSVVPLVPVSRRGLGTKKWWLCRQMIWLARFFDWDFH